MWSDEKKAAAERDLSSVGKMYGLHPGVGEVEKAAQAQAAAPKQKIPETPIQKPYIPPGEAARQGIEATPTKSFTFSQSPKAEIPANHFSAFDATLLPGWQAKTGMVPIPKSVDISSENLLAATPLGAYTNIWNNEGAGAPAASVFADMDDETLSQLITAYSDQMRKLKSAGLWGNSGQGFDWGDLFDFWGNAADAAGLQAGRVQIVTPRDIPTPGSQPGVPGTVKVDIDPFFNGKGFSSADDVFKFRLEDGEINVTGLDYLLENGDLNELQKAAIEMLDGAEMPEFIVNLLKNSDELASATKLIKNGGTALGIIGMALDAYEFGGSLNEDLHDEDKKIGKKTYTAAASTIGGWGGGWVGAKIGAMGGAATGTLICPGIGTVIGGFIGGVVGGIAGSIAGRESAEYLFDEVYQGN
ncbi:hypothetical protein SDC9_100415 [bioreactor metagenome]|uniref:Glycine zipper domain-containing protein n=1 Tax=bioreactor metagenome TaxID=1076179 RepID=A0A645AL39_9ZZZZ